MEGVANINMSRFENKPMPVDPPETKIVEAYGLGKCPKLVRQIAGPNLDVRINALAVLCDEFKNPYSIEGCAREGVTTILARMIIDPDFTTRVRASHALYLSAVDANGLDYILQNQALVLPLLVQGVNDPSEIVRENVYQCILSISRTTEGIHACVRFGVTQAFVAVLKDEMMELKPPIIKTIHNLVATEDGLLAALKSWAVEVLISHLDRSPIHNAVEDTVISEAARSVGYLCYDGRAKKEALDKGAVEKLITLLKDRKLPTNLKGSVTIALMAITITNDGKIKVHTCEGLDAVMVLLYDDSRMIVLNALKIIANLAVYPPNRELFIADSTCVVKLRKLSKAEDPLISRHAALALSAVNWNP